MSFHYLATPHSKYPGGLDAAFRAASAQAAVLLAAGVPVFCPIAHSHPMVEFLAPAKDTHETWLGLDEHFMRAAKGLIICKLTGWENSYGVTHEAKRFGEMQKPIVFMEPGCVPAEVLPSRRRVIGLCGYAGSGKDEAAKGLFADGWERVALADALRKALLALDPEIKLANVSAYLVHWESWDELKRQIPEVRELLQRMGTEAGRDIHGQDCWVNIARRKILATTSDVVVTDIRFANEAAMIRELGGVLIRVERPGVGPVNEHVSEVMPFEADHTLLNDGTIEQLHDTIRQLACIDEPTDLAELEAA
jgi:hypothetical protein